MENKDFEKDLLAENEEFEELFSKKHTKSKNGKRKLVLTGTFVLVIASLIGGAYLIKKYSPKPKNITIDNNVDLEDANDFIVNELAKEKVAQDKIENLMVDYYNNNKDKYPYSFEEFMTYQLSYLSDEEIEDIYGSNIPSQKKLEKYLSNFYTKAQYNASYITLEDRKSIGYTVPFNNEGEKEIAAQLEEDLASINTSIIDGDLTSNEVDSIKEDIYSVLDNNNYSDGLKGYVTNVILAALTNSLRNTNNAFSNKDNEQNNLYLEKYNCAVLSKQFVTSRDKALGINGSESEKFGELAATLDEINFISGLKLTIEGLDTYPSSFEKLVDMKFNDIEVSKDSSKEVKNNSNNTSTNSDKNNSTVEKGKTQTKADEKKVAKTTKELQKLADAAVQVIVDDITEYFTNFISAGSNLDDTTIPVLRNKIKTTATVTDNHYEANGKLKKSIVAAFYNEDKEMTKTFKNAIINGVISGLTEYNKKHGISEEMVKNIEKAIGFSIRKNLEKAGLKIGITEVRNGNLAGSYEEKDVIDKANDEFLLDSSNYLMDVKGNYITINGSKLKLDASYRIVDDFGNVYTTANGNIYDKNNKVVYERPVTVTNNTTNSNTNSSANNSSSNVTTDENGITWYNAPVPSLDFTDPQKTY